MVNDIEHISLAYWAFVYLLEKCAFKSFAHFLIELVFVVAIVVEFQEFSVFFGY